MVTQILLLLFAAASFQDAPAQAPSSAPDILAKTTEATVVVLCGEGAGRLSGTSTGVVVRADGLILAAYHAIKEAKEVQIRLKNGEVYDQVTLIGVDDRRDVAALKISATQLAALPIGSSQQIKPGDPIHAVTNSNGLSWSASQGMVSALRMADEVPGAGSGYRVIQFSSDVKPGSSGGPVVDAKGTLVGIITRGIPNGAAFAVPIESVIGLIDSGKHVNLGGGSALRMPEPDRPAPAVAAASADAGDLLRKAKTAVIHSHSIFFTTDTLEQALQKSAAFAPLGLALVKDQRVADITITIDRPVFTYDFTYIVMDIKTSRILESGKVTAFDGNIASGRIAKDLIAKLAKVRLPAAAKEEKKKP